MKDVYSQSFAGVREDDTLSHCLSLFEKDKLRVLFVLDNEDKYTGGVGATMDNQVYARPIYD